MSAPPTLARRWASLSLSTRILIGLGLGVATGLFLGEAVGPLQLVADAYVRLMQMTVIPYVTVALITSLGQLELRQAKTLAVRGGLLLFVFWGLLFVVLAAMPLSFPDYESASFFSTSLIEERPPPDLVRLYIPDNPFHSLANSVVPAVVLFSAAVGIALIGIEKKAPLMDGLAVFMQALSRVTRFVVSLTPVGVFGIGATAAGTMTLAEFERLQVYFVAFFVAAGLLAFGVIPLVVTALTPFRYRDVVGVARDALLTAFVTNNVFIVLPILIEQSKGLIRRYGLESGDAEAYVDVIIPIAFNFPTVGKLLTLLFVPFAAWLSGAPLAPVQYPGFFLTGLVSYFAKAQTALPFLMDLMRVPHDLFQLYIPTTLLNGKLDSLVGAMHLLALGLIGAGAMGGWITLRPGRIARSLLTMAVGIAVAVGGTTLLLARTVNTTYTRDEVLKKMHLPRQIGTPRIYRSLDEVEPDPAGGASGLRRIRERGTLRVGYDSDRVPYAFVNAKGDLVGFDVELATQLAEDLGVALELVPYEISSPLEGLETGRIDVVPSLAYLAGRLQSVDYSLPYLESTLGFAVPDDRRHDFASAETIRELRRLRLGVPVGPNLIRPRLERYLGGVPFELVPMNGPGPFFRGRWREVDALLVFAEVGTAWTLMNPEFSIVVPRPPLMAASLGFAVSPGDDELLAYLDEWITVRKADHTFEQAYEYWVLGEGAQRHQPRWSVLRDVLGWVE